MRAINIFSKVCIIAKRRQCLERIEPFCEDELSIGAVENCTREFVTEQEGELTHEPEAGK